MVPALPPNLSIRYIPGEFLGALLHICVEASCVHSLKPHIVTGKDLGMTCQ